MMIPKQQRLSDQELKKLVELYNNKRLICSQIWYN